VGGLFFYFEAIRTASSDSDAPAQERLENTTSFKTRLTMQSKNHEHTIQTIVEASVRIKFAALLSATVRPIHWWICAHRKTHMPNKGKTSRRPSICRSGV
jgi:hypothetical protein